MTTETVPLANLMVQAKELAFDRYLERFLDLPDDVNELTFGPMDWLEADVWSSVAGKLHLHGPEDEGKLAAPPDIQSLEAEVDAVLRAGPCNSDLIGLMGLADMPRAIRDGAALWRPDTTPSIEDQPTKRTSNRFFNSDGHKWEHYHQTLPLFWSRQTYRVDLSFYDWLTAQLRSVPEDKPLYDHNFEDAILGGVAHFSKKWRPFEGACFAVDKVFAQRGWKRKFTSAMGEAPTKVGRPNKSVEAVNKYFDLFPSTHHRVAESERGSVSWKAALNAVISKIGYDIGESTFKREIRKDPRYQERKNGS